MLLEPGRYRFEGRLRSDSIVGLSDRKGAAAGLRVSGSRNPRPNRLEGSSGWTTLSYSFQVEDPLERVVLVCELRATQGKVWFDLGSLKLSRLPH